MKLLRLFEALTASHIRLERLKTVTTMLGLSLGIALFVAIRLANESAWQSFKETVDVVAPSGGLRIVGSSGGVPEQIVPDLLNVPGVVGVSPLLIGYARAFAGGESIGTVQLLGIDPLSFKDFAKSNQSSSERGELTDFLRLPQSGMFSQRLNLHKSLALELPGGRLTVSNLGSLKEDGLGSAFGGRVIVFDIANLQDLLRRWSEVDSLDVLTNEADYSSTDAKERISKLPRFAQAHLSFEEPGEREFYGKKLTEAFRLNLNFLALLALAVAALLTYNSASYSVLKRRKEFAIVLSLGGRIRDLQSVVIWEALLFGFTSSLLGLLLGYLLAGFTLSQLLGTLNALYLPMGEGAVVLSRSVMFEGLLIGPLLSLISYLIPLQELRFISPVAGFSSQNAERAFSGYSRSMFVASLVLALASFLTAKPSLLKIHPFLGLLSPALLIVSSVLVVPALIRTILGLLSRMGTAVFPIEVVLAADHIQQTVHRSAVAVAAMAISIGMYLGVSTLIVSFRETVVGWIEHVTTADVYVSPQINIGTAVSAALPGGIIETLMRSSLVDEIDTLATRRVMIDGKQLRVNGVRFEIARRYHRMLVMSEERQITTESLLNSGPATITLPEVSLSEPAANRLGLRAGDTFVLPGIKSSPTVFVSSVYYDYSSDQGVVLIPEQLFEDIYATKEKQGLSLYLREGVEVAQIRELLDRELPNNFLFIRDNLSLQAEVLRIFDRTFLITYALQAIAFFISGVTLLNTLLMLVLERQREITVLRAIGASRRALAKLIVSESIVLSLFALFVGLVLGAGLALQLVFVVNKFYFGWSVFFAFPLKPILTTVSFTIVLALLVALGPTVQMIRSAKGGLLRYD